MSTGRTYRVGFLGAGFIADFHATALKACPNAELVAVCDLSERRARALAEDCGVSDVYTSLEAMLERGGLDAVHNLLPPNHHFETSKQCLEAGVHVFSEKPMALTKDECQGLIDAARANDKRIAVGHNFLFVPAYERLRADIQAGRLGQLDRVEIVWAKILGFPENGPFNHWMLADSGNICLETGPHPLAFLVDLLGGLDEVEVLPTNPLDLPTGVRFFRRWVIRGRKGPTELSMYWSYPPGIEEHEIRVRGNLGRARVDVERNLYSFDATSQLSVDLDTGRMLLGRALCTASQATYNATHSVLTKLKLSQVGKNGFDASMRNGIKRFYETLEGSPDPRHNPECARDVVAFGKQFGDVARELAPAPAAIRVPRSPQKQADCLVLGGTGFIGRELVRQLVAKGQTVRVLGRSAVPGMWGGDESKIDMVRGSMGSETDLNAAMEGVRHVYHLAKGAAKTWDEWLSNDVEPTRRIAQMCLEKGVERMIYTSTIHAYHTTNPDEVITRHTPLDPHVHERNYYSQAKKASEELLLQMHREQGLPVVIHRPGVVVGTGGTPFHFGVGYWSNNRVCELWGDGRNIIPTVLVEDVASGLILSSEVPGIDGECFLLTGHPHMSAQEYCEELQRYAGIEVEVRPTPFSLYFAADFAKWLMKVAVSHPGAALRPTYRDWKCCAHLARYDSSDTQRVLGWQPESSREAVIRRGIQVPMDEFLAGKYTRPAPEEAEAEPAGVS